MQDGPIVKVEGRLLRKIKQTNAIDTPQVPGLQLQPWQEQKGEYIKCLACNKYCDGNHETTESHKKKLESWLQRYRTPKDFSAPKHPWLAFVEDKHFSDTLEVKCLLCKTWVTDVDDCCPPTYQGLHGFPSRENSQQHVLQLKKFYSDPENWEPWIRKEKHRHHPELADTWW